MRLKGSREAAGRFRLAASGAALLLAACGEPDGKTEAAKMGSDDRPWWADIYEEARHKARGRTEELMRNAKVYPRPPRNPKIVAASVGNRIALVDTSTGSRLITQSTDHERRLGDFRFTAPNGKLICIFMTQFGGGHYMKWEVFPVRVYNVEVVAHSSDGEPLPDCLSFEKFAEFLTAFPDFANSPGLEYIVIDAPSAAGERL